MKKDVKERMLQRFADAGRRAQMRTKLRKRGYTVTKKTTLAELAEILMPALKKLAEYDKQNSKP